MRQIGIFILLVIITSCSVFKSDKPAMLKCLSERSKNLTLRWGDFLPKENSFYGYEINAYGELFFYTKNQKNPDGKKEKISNLDPIEVCSKLKLVQETILKTQTLFSPGENSARFVEFSNPDENMNMLAVWNPAFQTKGSKYFRELYDSLNILVPSIRELKNKR